MGVLSNLKGEPMLSTGSISSADVNLRSISNVENEPILNYQLSNNQSPNIDDELMLT